LNTHHTHFKKILKTLLKPLKIPFPHTSLFFLIFHILLSSHLLQSLIYYKDSQCHSSPLEKS
ncbi:hypothetical protein, partial [Helicobacter typhlonius]